MPNAPYITLLAGLAIHTLLACAAIVAIRRNQKQKLPPDRERWPGISILKPLCGRDDELAENLESFFQADYDSLQLILAARDPRDPALEIARRVAAHHPRCDVTILTAPEHRGWNFKVGLLEAMTPHARHDLLLISDSNVRTDGESLRQLAYPRSPVGLHHPRKAAPRRTGWPRCRQQSNGDLQNF